MDVSEEGVIYLNYSTGEYCLRRGNFNHEEGIRRVLKPGGPLPLVATTPSAWSFNTFEYQ